MNHFAFRQLHLIARWSPVLALCVCDRVRQSERERERGRGREGERVYVNVYVCRFSVHID